MDNVRQLKQWYHQMFQDGDLQYSQYYRLEEFLRAHKEEINSSREDINEIHNRIFKTGIQFDVTSAPVKIEKVDKVEPKKKELHDLVDKYIADVNAREFHVQIDPEFQKHLHELWAEMPEAAAVADMQFEEVRAHR